MQLGTDTIPELTKLKNDKKAKLQARRGEILNYISVDSKYNLVIPPEFKTETKGILNDMDRLAADILDIDSLTDEVNDVGKELGFRDFGQQRQRYQHTINQTNAALQRGILQNILSKTQAQDMEITVNAAKEGLERLNQVTAPIIEKLEKLDQTK